MIEWLAKAEQEILKIEETHKKQEKEEFDEKVALTDQAIKRSFAFFEKYLRDIDCRKLHYGHRIIEDVHDGIVRVRFMDSKIMIVVGGESRHNPFFILCELVFGWQANAWRNGHENFDAITYGMAWHSEVSRETYDAGGTYKFDPESTTDVNAFAEYLLQFIDPSSEKETE